MFRSVQLDERGQSLVWHVFACIRIWDLKRLLSREGMSVYEVARAAHLCGTIRPRVIVWINQFAVPLAEQEEFGVQAEPAGPVPWIRGSALVSSITLNVGQNGAACDRCAFPC